MSRWLVIFALILTTNAFATDSRSLRPEWLTGIKGITNENRSDMHFTRKDCPFPPCGYAGVTVESNRSKDVDYAVPWARSAEDFANHHICIEMPFVADGVMNCKYFIWQHEGADGDLVRYSTKGWEWDGKPVPGEAKANGNRTLTMHRNGTFEFIKIR